MTAAAAGEEVIPASEHRALQQQVRELQRLLAKKTLEAEILKEALDLAAPKKTAAGLGLTRSGRFPVSTVATPLGLARSTITADAGRTSTPRPDDDLLARIKAVIADMPTYGNRSVHAILRRAAEQGDDPPARNHKRVWRMMQQHGLLLQRHAGARIVATTVGSRWPSATAAGVRTASKSSASPANTSAT